MDFLIGWLCALGLGSGWAMLTRSRAGRKREPLSLGLRIFVGLMLMTWLPFLGSALGPLPLSGSDRLAAVLALPGLLVFAREVRPRWREIALDPALVLSVLGYLSV